MTTTNEITDQSPMLSANGAEPDGGSKRLRNVYITGPRYGLTGQMPPEALGAYENVATEELGKGGQHVTVGPTFWRQFQRPGLNRDGAADTARDEEHPELLIADEVIVLQLPGWRQCATLQKELEAAEERGTEVRTIRVGDARLTREAATNLMKRVPEGERVETRGPGMQWRVRTEYRAEIETTAGTLTFELDVANAPATCGNFIHLYDNEFYDGAKIHMIVRDHTLHGGCTEGDDSSDAGYQIAPENGKTTLTKGDLAMNGTSAGNSSRWFVVTGEQVDTPEAFTVFGKLCGSEEALGKLNECEVNEWQSDHPMRPKEDIRILKARVVRKTHEKLEPYVKPEPGASTAKGSKKR